MADQKPEDNALAEQLMKDLKAQGVDVEALSQTDNKQEGVTIEPSQPVNEPLSVGAPLDDVVYKVDDKLVQEKLDVLEKEDDYFIVQITKKSLIVGGGLLVILILMGLLIWI